MSTNRPRESVWDYPRPPIIDHDDRQVMVSNGGRLLADTAQAARVLETSHPPAFYIHPHDVAIEHLRASQHSTFCEFKGRAVYWDLIGDEAVPHVAWSYPEPTSGFATIAEWIAFYPSKIECFVGGERVKAQEGGLYGGWITEEITGPFKGGPGTRGW